MPMMNDRERKLATDNIYLVHNTIHRYIEGAYPGTEFYNDLFQVGCAALCNAAMHADEIKCSFSTYATTCVRNAMYKFCSDENEIKAAESLNSPQEDEDESYNDKLACYDEYEDSTVIDAVNDTKKKAKKQVRTGIEILEYIASGYKSEEICEKLSITKKTYKRSLEVARKTLRAKLATVFI